MQLIIVGDSTVADYPAQGPLRGWGQMLCNFLEPDVTVINLAVCGRSTKTFIQEQRWQKALERCNTGDYVLIQFGHNDSHSKDKPEATDAATDYPNYLRRYVNDAKAKGATPILVTPMHRRLFDAQGSITQELRPYAMAMKAVADERKALCVDLHELSGHAFQELGDAGCESFFVGPQDRTHFSQKGAVLMARLIATDLRRQAATPLASIIVVPPTGKIR